MNSNSEPLFQSNKTRGNFVDDFPETARFTINNNTDGTRTLEFTATSVGGTRAFQDYLGNTQVSWLGNEPLRISGIPVGGTLSHGSPIDANTWELNPIDIPLLRLLPDQHTSGFVPVDLTLNSTGEVESIQVFVQPVADPFSLTASDTDGFPGQSIPVQISIENSADTDGSETIANELILSGIPSYVTLSANAGLVTSLGSGRWSVDRSALATLEASGTVPSTNTISVTSTSIDVFDVDSDTVIEDGDNGDGVDESDTRVITQTFELTIRDVATVTAHQTTAGTSDTSQISGTAALKSGDTFSVTVNSITYTVGDSNLSLSDDGRWELNFPTPLAEGVYNVIATITDANGNSASDTSTVDFIVESADICRVRRH